MMQSGDFSALAELYIHRSGYSERVLETIARNIGVDRPGFSIADVGAGTGKLTENLGVFGVPIFAVEPNDFMRAQGEKNLGSGPRLRWVKGSGESTNLKDRSVDWVLMGSSFHWTDPVKSLPEFHRILRPGGHLTVIWNPRDIDKDPREQWIEKEIKNIVPELSRKSSGAKHYTAHMEGTLLSTGHFDDVIYIEAPHETVMTPDRYLGAWQSVNDIQVQAGPKRFAEILSLIQRKIEHDKEIVVHYRTRSWTVSKK